MKIAIQWALFGLFFLFAGMVFCQPLEKTVVRVGIIPLEPLSYWNDQGEARGLYIDLLDEIVKTRGKWKIEHVAVNWDEGLEKLDRGELDLIVCATRTPQRALSMDFSKSAVAELWGQVFVRRDQQVESVYDLDGRRIGVMASDVKARDFAELAANFSIEYEAVEFLTHEAVFKAIQSGEVFAGVAPQHYGMRFSDAYGLAGSPVQFSPSPVFFAAKKGCQPELLAEIDARLIDWKRDKHSFYYDRLDYWLRQGTHKKMPTPLWLWAMLGGIGAAAVFLFGLNRILRYEIRRATDALRKSETVLRRAQEIALVGSWEFEVDKNQLAWSDETYRIFGVDPKTFRPSYGAFLKLVHPDDRARLDEAYTSSVREGRDSYECEHRIIRQGEVRYVMEKCEHERNAEGKITCSFGMVHDITEQKLAELALKRQNEELFRFNRVATGRELRMIQLKEEVNALCRLLGEPERYPLEFNNQANQRPC